MFCSKCGKELGDDTAFCDSCGAPASVASQPAEASYPEGPLPPGPPPAPNPTDFTEAPRHRISVPMLVTITVLAVVVLAAATVVPAVLVYGNSRKAAQQKACQSNQRNVQAAIMVYAANSPDEVFPSSLQDLIAPGDRVLKSIPTCPSGSRPYIWVKGGINKPPSISCPNRADHAL